MSTQGQHAQQSTQSSTLSDNRPTDDYFPSSRKTRCKRSRKVKLKQPLCKKYAIILRTDTMPKYYDQNISSMEKKNTLTLKFREMNSWIQLILYTLLLELEQK